jgi:secondary thiamine-phosphate synthase enzyme
MIETEILLYITTEDVLSLMKKMYYSVPRIYHTKKPFDIIDITDDIKQYITESGGRNGLCSIFTRHTTAVIKINEAEDGFRNDLRQWCNKNVSLDEVYKHNDLEHRDPKTMCENKEECLNGHSHIRAMLMGNTSETIPVQDGELLLGRWQRVLLFELDHAREREIIFSYI